MMEFLRDEQLEQISGGALLGIASPAIYQITGGAAVANRRQLSDPAGPGHWQCGGNQHLDFDRKPDQRAG